jgi:hypothetical protein
MVTTPLQTGAPFLRLPSATPAGRSLLAKKQRRKSPPPVAEAVAAPSTTLKAPSFDTVGFKLEKKVAASGSVDEAFGSTSRDAPDVKEKNTITAVTLATNPTAKTSDERPPSNRTTTSATTLAAAVAGGVGPTWHHDETSNVPVDRQRQWASLLHARPASSDVDGMSTWLLQVMIASDWNNKDGVDENKKVGTSVASKTDSTGDRVSSLSAGECSSSSSSSDDMTKPA